MEDIIATVKDLPEFDGHKELIRLENKDLGVVGFIAIHTKRGSFPSLGATRVWNYDTETDAIRDALRLSRLMSHKSVFADLPYGGAKATLMVSKDKFPPRDELFAWHASNLNDLNGRFITGSDVGVEDADVQLMRQYTRFVIGDNVPAAFYTALGVFQGIEVALDNIYRSPQISGRSFAIQGLGKTGLELVKLLHSQGGKIIVSDIDPSKNDEVVKNFEGVVSVNSEDIYTQKVDVFCPCALNYSINSITAPQLQCLAIAGSANNQMENPEVEQVIHHRGIGYAVDYVINNGGLISVADQYENRIHNDFRIKQKLFRMKDKLKKLFEQSKLQLFSPGSLADMAVKAVLNTDKIYDVS